MAAGRSGSRGPGRAVLPVHGRYIVCCWLSGEREWWPTSRS